jgi:hypothetical protein
MPMVTLTSPRRLRGLISEVKLRATALDVT